MGRILLAGGEVPPADVDIGLAAYTATLDLLRQVHRDLTGSAQRFTPRDIAQAEQRPVALFGRLLADVPRLHTGAPTDILTRTPTSAAGIRAGRTSPAPPPSPPPPGRTPAPPGGPTASAAAARAGRPRRAHPGRARRLRRPDRGPARAGHAPAAAAIHDQVRSSGLGIAADQTPRHAEAGPLPPLHRPLTPPPTPADPHPAAAPPTCPKALRRLGHHLRAADALRPRDVELIALTLARTAHQAGQTLTATGGPAHDRTRPRRVLHRHADLLARATDSTRRLATIEPHRPPARRPGPGHPPTPRRRPPRRHPAGRCVARAVAAELPDLASGPGRHHPPPDRPRSLAHPRR